MRFPTVIALAIAVLLVASACTSTSTSNDVEDAQREVDPTTTTAVVVVDETAVAPETTAVAVDAVTSVVPSSVEPEPLCSELPDDAEMVHPSRGDGPVADFDGDGIDDEIWLTRDDDVAPWSGTVQVVSSSDGSVSEPALGGLWDFDGVLAGSDLDGDGRHEVTYSLGGNTALTAKILELEGCELRAISSDDDLYGWDGELNFTYFAGGNACAPVGCFHSVVCEMVDGVTQMELHQIYPEENFLSVDFDESKPHDEIEMTYITTTFEIMNGEATMLGSNEIMAPLRDIPDWEGRPEFDCD